MSTPLPRASSPIAGNLPATPPFYRFLQQLALAQQAAPGSADVSGLQSQIDALQAEIDALPEPQALQVLPPLILQDGVLRIMQTQQTGARSLPRSWVFA